MDIEFISRAVRGDITFWKLFWAYQGVALLIIMLVIPTVMMTDSPSANPVFVKVIEILCFIMCGAAIIIEAVALIGMWRTAPALGTGFPAIAGKGYVLLVGIWVVSMVYKIYSPGVVYTDEPQQTDTSQNP